MTVSAKMTLPDFTPVVTLPQEPRDCSHLLLLRSSLAIKVGVGSCLFKAGDILNGVLVTHPVNTNQKVIIRTLFGTFNLNKEDVVEL